jgi:MFS family permease
MTTPPAAASASNSRLPAGIWALGFVSLLMDISSEMIHSLLPVFLVTTLGMSMLGVGLIEGAAEATALVVKVFSGVLSDYWGKRKPLTVLGYGLGAASKPLFALASTSGLVLGARLLDRVGKGIRGAPRDALIADLTPSEIRGAAYGLRQSLDTIGAVGGPLIAMGLMIAWNDDFRAVFWVAVIPAVLSFVLVALAVEEPKAVRSSGEGPRFDRTLVRRLGAAFWIVTLAGAALTLARFSEAFLILRAENLGVAIAYTPLVLVAMNLVYTFTAYPAGKLADRMSRTRLLAIGIACLVAADIALALAGGLAALGAGVLLWGLHMGLTQGLLSAMVAQTAPAQLRGTAFGVFNLASGLAMLAASAIAGALWHYVGPAATFWAGAALAAASVAITRFARW